MPHSTQRKRQVLHWDEVFARLADRAMTFPIKAIEQDLRAMGHKLGSISARVASLDRKRGPGHAAQTSARSIAARAAPRQDGVRVGVTARMFEGMHLKSALAGAIGALLVWLIGLHTAQTIVGALTAPTLANVDAESARLMAERRYAEAEPLYRLALSMEERASGSSHPNVALRLNRLAYLLQATSRIKEAEPLMLRALGINWQRYASDPITVAISLNNFAQLLEVSRGQQSAEEPYRFALAIFEQFLGPDHPDVAIVLNNLAHMLQATDRPGEAEALLLRALAIDMKHFGSDHESVVRDRINLHLVRQAVGGCGDKVPFDLENASFRPRRARPARQPSNLGQLLQLTEWHIKARLIKACSM
jgi:tetratricopeptide (TPR) repeat protein